MEEPGARVISDESYGHIVELSTGAHHITDGRIDIIVLRGAGTANDMEVVLERELAVIEPPRDTNDERRADGKDAVCVRI